MSMNLMDICYSTYSVMESMVSVVVYLKKKEYADLRPMEKHGRAKYVDIGQRGVS